MWFKGIRVVVARECGEGKCKVFEIKYVPRISPCKGCRPASKHKGSSNEELVMLGKDILTVRKSCMLGRIHDIVLIVMTVESCHSSMLREGSYIAHVECVFAGNEVVAEFLI